MIPAMSAVVAKYRTVEVTTSSPAQIVAMLYDGAIRFANEAAAAIERDDRAHAGERIGRALAILEELLTGLDPTHAPELVERLQGVYVFCMHRLVEANLRRDRALLAEVVRVLSPLRDAWKVVAAAR